MGVQGKRAGTLRKTKKDKEAEAAAEAERKLSDGEVPAETEPTKPPPPNFTLEQELILLSNTHLPQWEASLARVDEAKKAYGKAKSDHQLVGKAIRAEMGPKSLDTLKLMIEMKQEGAEERLKEELELKMRVARFYASDLPLFSGEPDREPAVDKAARLGRSESLQGLRFDPSRYAQGTPQLAAFEKAWYQAQDERVMLMAMPKAEPAPIGDQPATHVDAEKPAEEWPETGQPDLPRATETAAEPA